MTDSPRKLLIVEDDPGIQSQLRWCFEDYEVISATDRATAINELRRHEPAVVLQDLGLPPDDSGVSEGFATLREILKLAPFTKVVVITGHGDQGNAVKAVGLGAYDFYQKPVDVDTLQLIVQRAYQIHALEAENRQLAESLGRVAARRRHRGERRHAQGLPDDREGGADERDDAAARRKRHRQGSLGARHSHAEQSARRTVRRDQLRGHPGHAARVGAVRLREGRVHGRREANAGQDRKRRRRHVVPRRDRRHAGLAASEAPAVLAAADDRAHRRPRRDSRRRARGVRDQQESAPGDGDRRVPRGPVLPNQRDHDRDSAAARARRRAAAARAIPTQQVRQGSKGASSRASPRTATTRSRPMPGPATSARWRTRSRRRSSWPRASS